MFTDEPCIMGRGGDARMVAWTDGFLEKAESRGIMAEQLPVLWYDIGEHFYVLVNEGEQEISGTLSIYASDEIYVLDAWKGTIEPYNGMPLRLRRRESLILAVGANPERHTEICFSKRAKTESEIKLEHWSVAGRNVTLGSWTEKEETRDFCGTMTYETEFEWNNDKEECVIMDLGEVHEQAEVTVNGESAGFRLWAPYKFDITLLLQNGKNTIKVSVSNTQANRYTEHRLPSGLFGKVVLKCGKISSAFGDKSGI